MGCLVADKIFGSTLQYSSPAHGGWGVLKAAQLIPESYFLFVSPAACGRHGAIGACLEARKERVSYLFLEERSIVTGDYEQEVRQAVAQLLAHLKRKKKMPKVLGIFVSCIDDLLGTDNDSIVEELQTEYPDMRFLVCHMNPTSSDTGVPPGVNVMNKIHSLLEPERTHDNGVNLVGILSPLRKNSDLFRLLHEMHAEPVRHISDYDTVASYQDMAKSRLNLVLGAMGKYACRQLEARHHTPQVLTLTAFQPAHIRENYEKIAGALQTQCPDLSDYEARANEALLQTKEALNGMPVFLDSGSIGRPFELTIALKEAGINVTRIYASAVMPDDRESYEQVKERFPEIEIAAPNAPTAFMKEKERDRCLAIGYASGYLSGAPHVVDIDGQHGLYGYQGLIDLCEMMRNAITKTIDLEQVLKDAVLIV